MENNSVMLSNLPYPSSSSSPVFSSAAPNPINLMLGIMKHEVDCFPYTRQGGGGPTAVDQSMIFDDRQYYDQCGGNDFSGGGGAGNKETNVGDDDDGDCTKICSSGTSVGIDKKTTQKMKKKKHRYAFQTRSQVDILDDGYRWRKYGQKAVKNNKFPRSYYRCTNHGCNVKKQIQRLSKDEGVVVTTYEGIHSHPIDNSTDNFEHILNQMQIYTNIHPPIS